MPIDPATLGLLAARILAPAVLEYAQTSAAEQPGNKRRRFAATVATDVMAAIEGGVGAELAMERLKAHAEALEALDERPGAPDL